MTMRLYWVVTEDHCEDWFIVARNYEEAETFHEQNEGYLPGDAMAEEIITVPDQVATEAGWPSDDVLLAVGARFIDQGSARVVQLGNRRFCEGLMEETLRSLDDDRFEADGQGRLNGTERISREPN
jgi:hypothetical protein